MVEWERGRSCYQARHLLVRPFAIASSRYKEIQEELEDLDHTSRSRHFSTCTSTTPPTPSWPTPAPPRPPGASLPHPLQRLPIPAPPHAARRKSPPRRLQRAGQQPPGEQEGLEDRLPAGKAPPPPRCPPATARSRPRPRPCARQSARLPPSAARLRFTFRSTRRESLAVNRLHTKNRI